MAISIKTPEDIEKMRVAGRLAAEVLEMIEPYVKPGVSTGELDRICNDYIVNEQHAVSACLGYHGYPKSVCISINEVVCHGIPDDAKLLKDGDIVNIDVTVIKDGFHGDTSKMFIVGKPTIMGERLCRQLERKARTAKYSTQYELKTKLIRYGLSLGYDYETVVEAASGLVTDTETCDEF